MLPKIVGALVVVIALIALACFFYLRNKSRPKSEQATLSVYLEMDRDYRFLVGFPVHQPTVWATVDSIGDGFLILSSGERVRPDEAESFVVTYPSGELVDARNPFSLPLPESVSGLERQAEPNEMTLSVADVERPQEFVEITFGKSPTHPNDDNYYSTTLRNTSDVAVKVTKFAGFVREGGRLVLNTVTDGFFTEQQFKEWYGVDADGWIKPGQEATDPSNYGGGDSYWVYFCESAAGKEFLVKGSLSNR